MGTCDYLACCRCNTAVFPLKQNPTLVFYLCALTFHEFGITIHKLGTVTISHIGISFPILDYVNNTVVSRIWDYIHKLGTVTISHSGILFPILDYVFSQTILFHEFGITTACDSNNIPHWYLDYVFSQTILFHEFGITFTSLGQ